MKLNKTTLHYIKNMKPGKVDFSSGIIRPDGEYILTKSIGHLKTLMKELRKPEAEIWKQIPDGESAIFWCIRATGCMTTDEHTSFGLKMTPEQQKAYTILVKNRIIEDKYYEI